MLNIAQFPSRPTKVRWTLPPLVKGSEWASVLPSKSVRQLVHAMPTILEHSHISAQIVLLTENLFKDWLEYYTQTMISQNHEVVATLEWFHNKVALNQPTYLIEFTSLYTGKRVGSSIVVQHDDGEFIQAFRASDRIELSGHSNVSAGTLLSLSFIQFAYQSGATKVSAGRSRNSFGKTNTIGFLTSNLRLGFIPTPDFTSPFDQELPRKDETSPHAWFIQEAEGQPLKLLLFPDEGHFNSELLTYMKRLNIPFSSYQGELK